MNESQVTQTALPEATPPRSEAVSRASGWTAGRITAIVIGTLLVLLSLALLGAGGTALWADRTQRDGGYVTTDVHEFSTSGRRWRQCRPSWDRRGWAGCTPRGCSTKFGYESRRRAPARRCSSGSTFHGCRSLPHGREPHRHQRVLGGEDGGSRRRRARIRSRNAGLLGRLLHRLRGPDSRVGSRRRIVDGRRDECRWTPRDRRRADTQSPHAGGVVDRYRLPSRWAVFLAGGALLIVGAFPPRPRMVRTRGEVMSTTSITPPRVHWRAGKKKLIAIKR